MVEEAADRRLPEADLEPMLRAVEPDWRLRGAAFVADGEMAVYRLEAEAPDGDRTCFLKASASPEAGLGVGTEARLTAVVREHTDAPVPAVLGAVDEHDSLRAPFFLMVAMPGRPPPMTELAERTPAEMRALGRQTGRWAAQLHGIEVPGLSRFGTRLNHDADRPLLGEPPAGDPDELTGPPHGGPWLEVIRSWTEEDLEALAETDRFADLVEPIRGILERRFEGLPRDPEPALGRVDQGLWNVLVDEPGTEITAMLDWGSLFVVPPAFDLAVMELFLAGRPWIGLDDVPDHREAIRSGLFEGYREHRAVPPGYDARRQSYQLQVAILLLVSLDRGPERPRHVPADRIDEVAAGFRPAVEALLD